MANPLLQPQTQALKQYEVTDSQGNEWDINAYGYVITDKGFLDFDNDENDIFKHWIHVCEVLK